MSNPKSKIQNPKLPRASSLQPVTAGFKEEGDAIILLGETKEELGKTPQ